MWVLQPPVPPAAFGMHARQRPCRTPLRYNRSHTLHLRCMVTSSSKQQPPNAKKLRQRLLQGAPPIVQWWDAASVKAQGGSHLQTSLPCTVMVEGKADARAVSKAVVPEVGDTSDEFVGKTRCITTRCPGWHHRHGRRNTSWHACVSHLGDHTRSQPGPAADPAPCAATGQRPCRKARPPRYFRCVDQCGACFLASLGLEINPRIHVRRGCNGCACCRLFAGSWPQFLRFMQHLLCICL